MSRDVLSDFLSHMQNSVQRKKKVVRFMHTNLLESVARVLEKKGYLRALKVKDGQLVVKPKYSEGVPRITTFKRVSKPGARKYRSYKHIQPVLSGRGVAVISTSKGVVDDYTARSEKLGGEILCEVW